MSDIDNEIEKLKMRRVEMTHKLNMAEFVDEKEEYEREIESIQRQIDVLERLKMK